MISSSRLSSSHYLNLLMSTLNCFDVDCDIDVDVTVSADSPSHLSDRKRSHTREIGGSDDSRGPACRAARSDSGP